MSFHTSHYALWWRGTNHEAGNFKETSGHCPSIFISFHIRSTMITVFSEDPELFKKKILHFFYKGEGIGNVFFVLAKVVIFPHFVPESPMKKELNCIFCVYLYWFRLACIVFHFFVWIHFFPLLLEIGPSGILWGTMYVNFISPSLKKKKKFLPCLLFFNLSTFFFCHTMWCAGS